MPAATGVRAAAVRETIAELTEYSLAPQELLQEVAERVRRIVPYERGAWSTTDPETLLQTDELIDGPPLDCEFGLTGQRIELAGTDVNLFDQMDRGGAVAASLAMATGGDLAASPRHQSVLAPRGLGDELRLVARSGDATWGIASLVRASDDGAFTEDEIRFVASVAGHLGRGLRAALATTPVAAPASGGPGTLVLDAENRVELSTADAERWLALMPSPYGTEYLPPAIEHVAEQAQAITRGERPLRPARLRMQIPDEGWLLVRGDVLNATGGGAPRTAVTLEPAGRPDLVPVLYTIYGLTAREREVTALLTSGASTDAIAERLAISRHTLRDHVKAIFAKVGVASRPELTAIFGSEASAV